MEIGEGLVGDLLAADDSSGKTECLIVFISPSRTQRVTT
jgi:hypothetical protein